MPEPESLGSIISRGRVPGPRRKKQRLDLVKSGWEHLVGPRLAEHSEPTRLARGVLTVSAEGPAWAAELTMATHSLLTKIERAMGQGEIKKIKVRSRGGGEGPPDGAADVGAGEETAGDDKPIDGKLGEEIRSVEDEQTRKALERMVRASKAGKQSEQKPG